MGAKLSQVDIKTKYGNWIPIIGVFLTITFNSKLTDPFNSPKFWVLLLGASLIAGPVFGHKIILSQDQKRFYLFLRISLIIFLVGLFASAIFAYDTHTAFFGENFRRNGLLSVLAFLIIFMGCIKFIRFESIDRFFKLVVITATIVGLYSLIQITKNDFIIWSNPNAIISTLGNTNYAGATMAIFVIIVFGQLFLTRLSLAYKFYLIMLISVLLVSIWATQARQAVITLILGCAMIIIYKIFVGNRKFGSFILLSLVPLAIFSVSALFQIGPLQNLLYKTSISIRGYYWRAGIEMFSANPILGVGIDNYGYFFKEFREFSYPLKYGFSLTSTNAHNVFIHYFATGGVLVGLSFLIIQGTIFYRSVLLIKNSSGDRQLIYLTMFAAWIGIQAQSLISIDHIGGIIWGWLLGGGLIGLSLSNEPALVAKSHSHRKSIELRWKEIIPSTSLVLVSFLVIVQLYSGERNTNLVRSYTSPNSTDSKIRESFNLYADRVLRNKFTDISYKNGVLAGKFEMGYREESLKQLEQMLVNNPRNLDTLLVLAVGYEQIRKFDQGIKFRKEIMKYDPWNAQNYLATGVVYKYTQDYKSMQEMLLKILSFAGNDPIAEIAKTELVIPSS